MIKVDEASHDSEVRVGGSDLRIDLFSFVDWTDSVRDWVDETDWGAIDGTQVDFSAVDLACFPVIKGDWLLEPLCRL